MTENQKSAGAALAMIGGTALLIWETRETETNGNGGNAETGGNGGAETGSTLDT
jgi:hypothetical protein